MSKRRHLTTPYVGAVNKWDRDGHQVGDSEGKILFQGESLRQAKRFYRTGKAGNSPVKPKFSSRRGGYIPQGRS